jgi:hypothetical protein
LSGAIQYVFNGNTGVLHKKKNCPVLHLNSMTKYCTEALNERDIPEILARYKKEKPAKCCKRCINIYNDKNIHALVDDYNNTRKKLRGK